MSSLLDLLTPTTIKSAAKNVTSPSDAPGLQGKGETSDSFRQSMARESHNPARPREPSSADKVTSTHDHPRSDQVPKSQRNKNTAPAETNAENTTTETAAETPDADAPDGDNALAMENAEAAVPADVVVVIGKPLASPEVSSSQPEAMVALKPAAADPLLRNRPAFGNVSLTAAHGTGAEAVVEGGKPMSLLGVGPDAATGSKSDVAHLFHAGLFKTAVDATQAIPLDKAGAPNPSTLKFAEMPVAPITQGATVTRNASFAKMLQSDTGQLFRMDSAATGLVVEVPESRALANPGSVHVTSPLSAFNMAPTDAVGARMQVPVNITFGQPQWANMVAERSAWLFSQNISSAELMLDPPELGRMSVQIQVHNNEQASVTFTSANHNVRDALDQTTQRLRELLAEQGLDLVNVDVADRQASDEQNPQSSAKGGSGTLARDGEAGAGEGGVSDQVMVNVGIDHYV